MTAFPSSKQSQMIAIFIITLGVISQTMALEGDRHHEKRLSAPDVNTELSSTTNAGLKALIKLLAAVPSESIKSETRSSQRHSLKESLSALYPVRVAFDDEDLARLSDLEWPLDIPSQEYGTNSSSPSLTSRLSYQHGDNGLGGDQHSDEIQKRSRTVVNVPGEGEPLPWKCAGQKAWRRLGRQMIPRFVETVKCEQDVCYHGHFVCQPVYYTLKALQLVGEEWRETEEFVTVACECGRGH
ncbi:uncharacterized protein [Ptychodera flava]|uniref:uncharacterized protein n=1 Tax=Ptychodera flava TaxID=63121 RepID=UPI00396A13E2